MTVLLDTTVLVGAWLERDDLHVSSAAAMRHALAGGWGPLYISDYILDEAVTLTRSRTGDHRKADRLAGYLLGEAPHPGRFQLARVGPGDFAQARAIFHRYGDHALSFTDCTSIALVRALGLGGVVSHDRGFDGIVRRIDPSESPSLAAAP